LSGVCVVLSVAVWAWLVGAEEGHYLYHLRVIPTVEKRLNKAPSYNYQFAWQESLHKVRL
jgi:hypothetical protein